jgi:protease IV
MESNPNRALPEQPIPAQVLTPRPPRRRRTGLRALLVLLLLMALGGSAMLNLVLLVDGGSLTAYDDRVQEELFSNYEYTSGRDKIAIISLEGTILSGEGAISRQIERAARDKNVKAVVLRVNSPGGTITGSDYLYHRLNQLREKHKKPIVVSMGGIAASGGYYVAMAVGSTPETVYAEPTTWTGSIGVIIPHYNASELMSEWGIEEDSVASHKLKNMGSLARKMTDEEREIFQVLVDEGFNRFKDIVKSGRPSFNEDPGALDELATGQVYTAEQAKANGLVDKIGFLEDAIERAIALAGVDPKEVRVVRYRSQPTLAGILFGSGARQREFGLAEILDVTAPRAYYLCTRMPPLIQNGQ